MENFVFIDLEEKNQGIWIGRENDDLSVIPEIDIHLVSKGQFEIEGEVFNYIKISY